MNAFKFGNPNLFVQGMVDVTGYEPTTGNIVCYDRVLSDGAVTGTSESNQIVGGEGNAVQAEIFHSARVSGSLTSQAFSMEQRALSSGGTITYDGIAPVCEEITATSTTLTVSAVPAKHYGQLATDTNCWCYVAEKEAAQFMGTNYGVNPTTKAVANFVATVGKTYIVRYFTNALAKTLKINSNFRPSVVTLQYKYNVYSKQNGSVANGSRVGILYFVVPRASFKGDVGISASQTENATTSYDWQALADNNNLPDCSSCGNGDVSAYSYYVYVPCEGGTALVENLVVLGGAVSVTVSAGQNHTAQIPVKYIMPDGATAQPTYSDLSYTSAAPATATVDANGVVTGVAAGDTEVTITLTKPDSSVLTTYCNVTVTA